MTPVRILLADDHTLVRAGIRALLGEIADFEVVAEAGDGREAVAMVKALQPDVVLMDISMPQVSGLDATRTVHRDDPDARVIILSMHASEEHVFQALQAGAAGYMIKGSATQELELAVRAVMRGELYLSPQVSRHAVHSYGNRTLRDSAGGLSVLTARQRTVLRMIAEGHANKQIANALALSVKTVEAHRAQLMQRLDIHDVSSLTRFAVRTGLVSSDQ